MERGLCFLPDRADKHLLFFKSAQADAITACFSEYSKLVIKRDKSRPAPIREQVKQAAEQVKQIKGVCHMKQMKAKLWNKDFTLVVIGQIISLFGNAVLRFALPLYILEQSSLPALFGQVSALAFLPLIMLSPVGGIIHLQIGRASCRERV